MTRQQERVWRKKIEEAADRVLQAAISWEQNPSEEIDLIKAVQAYLSARAGK